MVLVLSSISGTKSSPLFLFCLVLGPRDDATHTQLFSSGNALKDILRGMSQYPQWVSIEKDWQ